MSPDPAIVRILRQPYCADPAMVGMLQAQRQARVGNHPLKGGFRARLGKVGVKSNEAQHPRVAEPDGSETSAASSDVLAQVDPE